MKKIALLSLTKQYNYGACLQVYALWHVISKDITNESICKYIDYNRNYRKELRTWLFRKLYRGICRLDDNPSYTINEFLQETRKHFRNKVVYSNEVKEKFKEFQELTPFTPKKTKRELVSLNNEFDIFIVGSDQVWNPGKVNLDTTYLLDFVKDGKKRFSYASSLGMDDIPIKYKKAYKNYLNKFDAISVREKANVEVLNKILDGGKKAIYQCDPTLLLNKEEWNSITQDTLLDIHDYVLIYDLTDKDEICRHIAKVIAESNNLKICIVSQKNNYGPKEWVQLFINANYVVTNSFHGTAFSINFSKEFISLIPEKDFFVKSSNRISGILADFGLEERMIRENEIVDIDSDKIYSLVHNLNKIDYESVQSKLDVIRKNGIDYLKGFLE